MVICVKWLLKAVDVIVMSLEKSTWRFSLLVLLTTIVLLKLSVFVKFPEIAGLKFFQYEKFEEDFQSDFVDSKINCFHWSVLQSRPSQGFSPTAAEIAKRIEEEKRVLNLKMSAYG